MKAETWNQVKDLLNEVLEIEPDGRRDFLAQTNVSPEIISEVESLLACENAAADLMDAPAIAFAQSFLDDDDGPDNALIGQNIGVYKIVSELGYGGMGAVYLAERADGKFSQRVALKLLKRELNTASLRQRFEQERQILASLEHPNIARLLDAGATDDGVPYFAMEYIEGLPIDVYCQHNDLTLNERLDLFREVCSAVNFAHRNLIVHRDLKPSNILVNQDRIPKLLDFGISKIISDEFHQTATITKFGAMTPSYASPEQLQNKATSTATDIYSLGVVLYELLSGHRPFESLEHDLKEIYQAVIEANPPAPSSITGTQSSALQFRSAVESERSKNDTADNRHIVTTPHAAAISAQYLRGDLDNIVLKALRKEPERRYSSAENFAEDIHRYQRGLTVTARPNTFSYRATKFINRNKPSVIAATLLIFAVITGIIATVWQASVAKAESVRAHREAEKSKRINEYMQGVLNFSNPNWLSSNPKRNREATISDALDEALKNLETDLASDPEIQAEIMFTISQTYIGQAQFDKAEKLLRQAIERFDQVSGRPNTMAMKASVVLADALVQKGKNDEAVKLYQEAIDHFRPIVGKDNSLLKWLVIPLNNLGNVYVYQGRFADAEAAIRESTEYAVNVTGKDRYVIPVVNGNLGAVKTNTGDFQGALIYLNRSIEELRVVGNDKKYEGGQLLNNLGKAYVFLHEYELADTTLASSREILRNTVGEKNGYFAQNLYYSATNKYNQGKYKEAEDDVKKQREIQQILYVDGHLFMGNSLRLLGEIYTKTDRVKLGEETLREALDYTLKRAKEPNPQISQAQAALAENLIMQQKYEEARRLLTSALDGYLKTSGEDHPYTKQCRELLSKV